MIKEYYGIWNMLDIIRIILMALYVFFTIGYLASKDSVDTLPQTEDGQITNSINTEFDEKRAEVFTLLVLVSFICLL